MVARHDATRTSVLRGAIDEVAEADHPDQHMVARLLDELRARDRRAADEMLPLAYQKFREFATLNTTILFHEA
jgi:hypothetical protein